MMEKLQQTKYLIIFQWIPSHTEISRNEKANVIAKNREEKRENQPKSEVC